MLEVNYNPWLALYKEPFGAVLVNSKVSFSIRVEALELENVTLVIHQEDKEEKKLLMRRGADHLFHVDFQVGHTKGLYFYWFQIVQRDAELNKISFVGRSEQDIAPVLYHAKENVMPYQMTCFDQADVAPEWYQEGICYQIFPDRFFNDQPDGMPLAKKKNSFLYMNTTDTPCYVKNKAGDVVRWDFYGGNLNGILEKIDYLKDLGINMIYLNPVFEARSNHRYDTSDYMHIDPMLGTDASFKEFLEVLHENGIRVILDGVFNHVGKNSRYFDMDGSHEEIGAYESKRSPYYPWFTFNHYPDDYASWWGVKDLPEVSKEEPSFQEYIYGENNSVITKWTEMGVDGWRLDVADELPDFFIEGIRKRLDHYPERVLIGEVWEDASNKIAYHQRRQYILGDSLYGVMNYPLKDAIIQLVNQQKKPEQIATQIMLLRENYPKDIFFNNLNHLGTHDTERILTLLHEDVDKLKQAVAFVFCMPGIPCVYYGDEAGLTGGKDPDNRKFYPWGAENQEVMNIYREWISLRENDEALMKGEVYLGYSDELFVIIRLLEEEFSVLCLNIGDTSTTVAWNQMAFLRPLPDAVWDKLDRQLEQKIAPKDLYYGHFTIKQSGILLKDKQEDW